MSTQSRINKINARKGARARIAFYPDVRDVPPPDCFMAPTHPKEKEGWGQWSMCMDWDETLSTDNWETENATVCWLVDEAPHEWLQVGAEFEVYEGRTAVAEVEILEILWENEEC